MPGERLNVKPYGMIIFTFAIPDEGRTKFDRNSEYFLGPIVTFKNENSQLEVIDGQQRLTTLMLLLRAFYAKIWPYEGRSILIETSKEYRKMHLEDRRIWKARYVKP